MKYKVFIIGYLMLVVILLTGSTIRIPPSRPGALRVQAAGVVASTTPVATWTYQFSSDNLLFAYRLENAASSQWTDVSPNGMNATQTDTSKQPTINSDGVSFPPGKFYRVSNFYHSGGTATYTMVARAAFNAMGEADSHFICDGVSAGNRLGFGGYSNDLYITKSPGSSIIGSYNGSGEHVFIVQFPTSASSARLFVDGSEKSPLTNNSSNGGSAYYGLNIGIFYDSTSYSLGSTSRLKNLYFYSRSLSADEISATYW